MISSSFSIRSSLSSLQIRIYLSSLWIISYFSFVSRRICSSIILPKNTLASTTLKVSFSTIKFLIYIILYAEQASIRSSVASSIIPSFLSLDKNVIVTGFL